MSDKFIPNGDDAKLCCHCWYARTRRDICGIYCTKGFVKDGKCDMYENYSQHKKSAKSKTGGKTELGVCAGCKWSKEG